MEPIINIISEPRNILFISVILLFILIRLFYPSKKPYIYTYLPLILLTINNKILNQEIILITILFYLHFFSDLKSKYWISVYTLTIGQFLIFTYYFEYFVATIIATITILELIKHKKLYAITLATLLTPYPQMIVLLPFTQLIELIPKKQKESKNILVVKYKNLNKVIKAFESEYKKGILLSRTPKSKIKTKLKHIWLTELKKKNSINPENLEEIQSKLEKSLRGKNNVLIDGIEYLINYHKINKVIKLLQHLRDIALKSNANLIIYIQPNTIEEKQENLLMKEFSEWSI